MTGRPTAPNSLPACRRTLPSISAGRASLRSPPVRISPPVCTNPGSTLGLAAARASEALIAASINLASFEVGL